MCVKALYYTGICYVILQMWQKRSDPVLHIELRKWADLFLIAPLDANSLAKIAAGICDNLLVSLIILNVR